MSKFFAPLFLAAAGIMFANFAAAQDEPKGDAVNGKKLFVSDGCYGCHGYAGQGGAAGPHLVDPVVFPAFIVQLRTPRALMPPYVASVLSDQQAADIYAYVKTFPKPVDPKATRLLQ